MKVKNKININEKNINKRFSYYMIICENNGRKKNNKRKLFSLDPPKRKKRNFLCAKRKWKCDL
jgi:tRNA-binding EMAP/Myf-like protein